MRDALELLVLEVSDIVHWTDDQLIAQKNPAYELIELALMKDSDRYDTANQLLRVGTKSPRIACFGHDKASETEHVYTVRQFRFAVSSPDDYQSSAGGAGTPARYSCLPSSRLLFEELL